MTSIRSDLVHIRGSLQKELPILHIIMISRQQTLPVPKDKYKAISARSAGTRKVRRKVIEAQKDKLGFLKPKHNQLGANEEQVQRHETMDRVHIFNIFRKWVPDGDKYEIGEDLGELINDMLRNYEVTASEGDAVLDQYRAGVTDEQQKAADLMTELERASPGCQAIVQRIATWVEDYDDPVKKTLENPPALVKLRDENYQLSTRLVASISVNGGMSSAMQAIMNSNQTLHHQHGELSIEASVNKTAADDLKRSRSVNEELRTSNIGLQSKVDAHADKISELERQLADKGTSAALSVTEGINQFSSKIDELRAKIVDNANSESRLSSMPEPPRTRVNTPRTPSTREGLPTSGW